MGYGYGRGRGGRWGGGGGWGKKRGWEIPFQQLPPPPLGEVRVAAPVIDNNGINSVISQMFARSPYIAIVDVKNGQMVSVSIHNNPAATMPQGAGVALAQWLISNNVRVVLAPNMGANLAQVLAQAGVYAYQVPPNTRLIDALRLVGIVR